MTEIFAYIGCFVLAALAIFQAALVLGAPIGRFAWGGAHDTLPRNLRVASISSIVLYAIFAGFLLSKAGIIDLIENKNLVDVGMWIMTGYFFIGVVMNAISRSRPERAVMTPAALILALVFLMVARS